MQPKEAIAAGKAIPEEPSGEAFASRGHAAAAILTGLAAVAIVCSIAASQILIGAALLLLLLSRRALSFPRRLGFPILAFMGWTILALAFSGDPSDGLSAIRKFFVFTAVVLVYNSYQEERQTERTIEGVILAGSLSALYGLGQFAYDYWNLTRQGLPFYDNYVTHQITGFMSHWMTFGGQLMMILLLAISFILAGALPARLRPAAAICIAIITCALLAAFTRGIWLGTLAGMAHLVATSARRRWLWLLPIGLLVLYVVSPSWLQRRSLSAAFEASEESSIQARLVMLETGVRMVAAHPWFGVGPERVGPEFLKYKPTELPLPRGWYGHLHNDYLHFAAERGVPFLLIWLWMLYEIIRSAHRVIASRSRRHRALGHAVVAITIGLMVSGLFEFNFGDSEVLILYLFLAAMAFASERFQLQEQPRHAGEGSLAALPARSEAF